jgi:hypothetical protein
LIYIISKVKFYSLYVFRKSYTIIIGVNWNRNIEEKMYRKRNKEWGKHPSDKREQGSKKNLGERPV